MDRKVAQDLLHIAAGSTAHDIANRNWLIHQYDQIDRRLTWVTLSRDPAGWRVALRHCSPRRGKPWPPSSPTAPDRVTD